MTEQKHHVHRACPFCGSTETGFVQNDANPAGAWVCNACGETWLDKDDGLHGAGEAAGAADGAEASDDSARLPSHPE